MKLHAPAIIYAVMCLLAPLCLSAQDIAPIRLQQRATAYIPRSFYVSDVTDSLPGKAAIGMVTDGSKKQPVTIQDGVAAAFKNYITHGQRRADNSQPVVMNVNKLDIDIKKKGSVWQVSAAMGVVFYAGGMRLVEYSGKGVAEVADPVDYVGGFISKALDNDLQRFDSWWAANKSRVPVSSAVKVNVTVSKVTTRPHHIVYNLRRPLQISDFTGPPAVDAPEFAATYSGMEFSSAAGETGRWS